jgi:hypothetical protein
MIDGRPCFVVGYTSGGAPYGSCLDEMDGDCLGGMIAHVAPAGYPIWIYPVREHRHRSVLTSRHVRTFPRFCLIIAVIAGS